MCTTVLQIPGIEQYTSQEGLLCQEGLGRTCLQCAIRKSHCCKVPAARQLHSRAPEAIPPQLLPVARARDLALCALLHAGRSAVGCFQCSHRPLALCRQLGSLFCKYTVPL